MRWFKRRPKRRFSESAKAYRRALQDYVWENDRGLRGITTYRKIRKKEGWW